jgi:DUF4097 and DUF4098 domain-containing protein YvlB
MFSSSPYRGAIGLKIPLFAGLMTIATAVFAETLIVDRIERQFAVTGRPTLLLTNVDGRTRVISGASGQVNVVATKEVRGARNEADARQAADRVEVRIEHFGSRVEVEAKYPRDFFSFGRHPQVLVHFDVSTPSPSDVELHTVDGDALVEGIDGQLEVRSVDGAVTLSRCAGRLSAKSVDGDLRVDDARGNVTVETVDGRISVDGTVRALQARSTDGRIEIDVLPGSAMDSEWSLRTTDGDIRLTLPENFSADLDVSTGDGAIHSDHAITITGTTSKHRLAGKMAQGGNLLRIRTTDGDIAILKSR